MHRHGNRPRQGIIAGIKQWFQAQRFRCPRCEKTFTRLPDWLLPFKQYVAQEIEGVLRHLFNGGRLIESPCGADESTLRRWWKEYRHKLLQWAGLLEAWIIQLFRQSLSSINCSDPLKRLEEALSQLAVLPSEWTVMVKTLWWLSTSHPL
jgi:transposase-like protein